MDPVALARDLIRCPSVTPAEGGALDLLERTLSSLGFACHRLPFGEGADRVDNLYARLGTAGPHLQFAGHTDVVPEGDAGAWRHGAFAGEIDGGVLYGRGAVDMKGAIAAFIAAAAEHLESGPLPGSLSLLITGDEEGPAVNGTVRVVDWLEDRDEKPDACIVGEPTNPDSLGDMIKIGRRGSLTGYLTVRGTAGHVAYPHRADNPIPRAIRLLERLETIHLDDGSEWFPPSNLEIVTVDTGNAATNVIPGKVTAAFNIRFNDLHDWDGLIEQIEGELARVTPDGWSLDWERSSLSFLSPPHVFAETVAEAVEAVTGNRPELSTSGGTSDARFIRRLCPVAEFGLVGRTMHQIDEAVPLDELKTLTAIYRNLIGRFMRQN